MKLSEIRKACERLEEGDAGLYWYDACCAAAEAMPALLLLVRELANQPGVNWTAVLSAMHSAGLDTMDNEGTDWLAGDE